jgi:hypothetical protein
MNLYMEVKGNIIGEASGGGNPAGPNTGAISRVAIAAQAAAGRLRDPQHPNHTDTVGAGLDDLFTIREGEVQNV